MNQANKKAIGGDTFEAVRFKTLVPYWRLKMPNGDILESGAGGFNGASKPKLFESVEYTLKRLGEERFKSFMSL